MEDVATTALKWFLFGLAGITFLLLAVSENRRHFSLFFIGYFIQEEGVRVWRWGDYWVGHDPESWANERGLATNATIVMLFIVFWLGVGLGMLAMKFL